jgi:ribosomal protein L7/L12
MDTQTLVVAMAALIIGFLLGRMTAGDKKEKVVWTEPPRARAGASSDADAEIRAYVQAGQKIHAIKLYRETYGVGLKEAKDAVDALE